MADIYMTNDERNSIKTLMETVKKLPPKEQDHVVWFSQGLLYASKNEEIKEKVTNIDKYNNLACSIDFEEK